MRTVFFRATKKYPSVTRAERHFLQQFCQKRWGLTTTRCIALAAVDRAIIPGLERYLGGLAAFSANSVEHFTGATGSRAAGLTCLTARLAPSRLILEALLGIEFLFAGSENEFIAAVFANQRLVSVHGLEPPDRLK
jgi:hypothetical protein